MEGLFVDLANLLPDNIRAQEIEPQAFLEGKLVLSGTKKQVIEIADIITWIEAFTNFCMILCHTFPSRWKDLNQYKLLIIQTARRFSDKSWLNYNIAFRKKAAATGSTDWSHVNPDLYNFHTRSPASTSAASGSSTSSAWSLAEPLATSGNPQSSQYCHSWNDGAVTGPLAAAGFATPAERALGKTLASTALTTQHVEHGPAPHLSQRGVTAIARPPLLAISAVPRLDSVQGGSYDNFSALELHSPLVLPS